ncbi:MAG: hypothetical protein ABW187_01740 [Dokdonella sp.]
MRLASIVLLSCLAAGAHAQTQAPEPLTPYQWQQQQKAAFETSERIYSEALKRSGLLAQYKAMRDAYRADKNEAFRIVFGQYLSWYQTFVGDYVGAHGSYSIRQLAAKDDGASPLGGDWSAKPALDAIAELARARKAVFFNEAHNVPLTRSLTLQLLSRLRAEGYTHFAAETLYQSDGDLQQRGYANEKSGFYTLEPISAEMVRSAIKLGFKVVAYESEKEGNGDVREYDQAKNLYERVFKTDPNARLVVNAGYAHIQENGRYLGGKSMAQHFRRLSDIDPLTIEQTMLIDHPRGTENHPYYTAVIEKLHPAAPIVFEDKSGQPWTLKPKAYDVSVVFPPDQIRDDRPSWLDLGGLRKPYYVNGGLCQGDFPCLIEARYANEGADAIPADRLVLAVVESNAGLDGRLITGHGDAHGSLYLRPGRYRLTATNDSNRVVSSQDVTIDENAPSTAPAAATPAKDAHAEADSSHGRSCAAKLALPVALQANAACDAH